VLAAIFGRWNLYGIGPGAALLQHPTLCRSGALAAIFGRWNLHGIGPGAALLQLPTLCRSGALAAIFGRWNLHGIGPRAALLQHPRGNGIAREPDSACKRAFCRLMDNPG